MCCACAAVHAQDDLVAKAQNERELVLYGTALAGQFDKFTEPFKRRYPFLKAQYSRTTGEALTTKILHEVSARQLSADVDSDQQLHPRIFMKKNIITALPAARRREFPAGLHRQTGLLVSAFTWCPTRSPTTTTLVSESQRAQLFRRFIAAKMERADLPRAGRVSGDPSAHASSSASRKPSIISRSSRAKI